MTIKQYQTNEMIFVEDRVAVILDGIVHVKSHADNVLPPTLLVIIIP